MRWKKEFPWKRIISAILGCCLALGQAAGLTGCGERPFVPEEETIELIEPTAELSGSETVMRRDMYAAKVYEVLVDPYIEDYSYEETRNFLPTGRKIGDTVTAGKLIYNADILSLAPQIERLTEKLAEIEKSYVEYYNDITAELNEQYRELSQLEDELEEIQNNKPKQESGPAYDAWSRREAIAIGAYNKKDLDIQVNELALSERQELMRLDSDYYTEQLKELRRQNEGGRVLSGINGQIIYLNMCNEGDTISAGTIVASVADMNRKRLVCPIVDSATRRNIQEQYAFFNGKKYDIVYDEESGDNGNSVFLLSDPEGEVPVGSYGSLVFYSGIGKQVLTVSREAIHGSGQESYVYVIEGGKPVPRTVKTGQSNSIYIEILSGLEEGERIFLDKTAPQAVNTAVMERSSVSLDYSTRGNLYYPVCFDVGCEVKHGTVIFQSWPAYETVLKGVQYSFKQLAQATLMPLKAGELIASIQVEPSDEEKLELEQMRNDLKRAEQRLADLVRETTSVSIDKATEKDIELRKEAIERMREQIAERVEAYGITAVRTERDGRLYYVQDKISYQNGNRSVSVSVQAGDRISSGYIYARMIDESAAYVLLPDGMQNTYGRLGYNTTMTVSYNNWENEIVTREVPVITINMKNNSQALFLDREILQDMNTYNTSYQGEYNKQTGLDVTGKAKCMDNVFLLPEKAIKMVSGSFGYVNVLEEDGSLRSMGIVVGTKYRNGNGNGTYYCVLDGLMEGMTVCWE